MESNYRFISQRRKKALTLYIDFPRSAVANEVGMQSRGDEASSRKISLTLIEDESENTLHEDVAEQPLGESEVDEEDCMGMKATPTG